MSYSNFTLKTVEKAFQLQETVQNLFPALKILKSAIGYNKRWKKALVFHSKVKKPDQK
jgi:hypothetical protein